MKSDLMTPNDQKPCAECGAPRPESPNRDNKLWRKYHVGLCMQCAAKAFAVQTQGWWDELEFAIGYNLASLDETPLGFDCGALGKLDDWATSYVGSSTCKGLVFEGPPGVGKTRMAVWLCKRLNDDGIRCNWVSESRFVEAVGDMGRQAKREDAEEFLTELAEVGLLFFDDLGLYGLTEARYSRLFALVDARYKDGLPTIWTTNLGPEGMACRIERFWLGLGWSKADAANEADRLLRRIYGTSETPLVDIVGCRPAESTGVIGTTTAPSTTVSNEVRDNPGGITKP